MPVYSFDAVSAQGDNRKGVIEADSARAARGLLRAQGLVPLRVEPVASAEPGAAPGAQPPDWHR